MEAVGQLTGGIAHDFNNLLAGISGGLEIIERRLAQGRTDGIEKFITGAQTSAQRAAALTQRLLAFSRRQTLDPKPTDVNRLVFGMEDLIRRTVGPQIAVDGSNRLTTERHEPGTAALSGDAEEPLLEIDVSDTEMEDFAAPRSRVHEDAEDRLVTPTGEGLVALTGRQKRPELGLA